MQYLRTLAADVPLICVGHRTRMAARALSRHYQAYFRGTSLTASQFAILVSLAGCPGQSIAELGADLGIEATAMVRAIQQLERRGMVAATGGRGRQSKRSTLTPAGRRALRRGLTRWRAAHDAIIAALGGAAAATRVLQAIRRVERAARGTSPATATTTGREQRKGKRHLGKAGPPRKKSARRVQTPSTSA